MGDISLLLLSILNGSQPAVVEVVQILLIIFIPEMGHSIGEEKDSACYNFNQFSFYFHVRCIYIGCSSQAIDIANVAYSVGNDANSYTSLTRTPFLSQKSNSTPEIRTPHY